jgi:predicted RNase H-like HicB family nuclease
MPNTYTTVTRQDGEWWIGWIAEIPGVNCQERTREELLASLKTAVAEALDLNRGDGGIPCGIAWRQKRHGRLAA